MKDSRFLELLKSFNSVDLKYLEFYVQSKFFNTNKKIVLLYNIILNYPENRSISELILFEQLNKEHSISKANFRMLLTDFSNLLETFLVHNKLRNNEITQMEFLLKHAFENNLQYLLSKTIARFESYFQGKFDLNLNEQRIKVEYLLINFLNTGKKKRELQDSLLSFIFSLYLKNLSINSNKIEPKFEKLLYEEISTNIKKVKTKDLFTYFYFLSGKLNSESLSELEELEKLYEVTNSTELRCLISECIITNYNIEFNKLLKYAIWIWENGSKRSKLINIDKLLVIIIQNREFELSKALVKFIGENNSSAKGYFSVALYYFYFNDFKRCLFEIENLIPSDKDEDAQIRQLKMCCFARLNHLKQFKNAYNAFKKFIAVNKKTEIVKDSTMFCRLLYLIINNKDNLDKLITVDNELMKTEVRNKKWLIDEMNFHFKNLAQA